MNQLKGEVIKEVTQKSNLGNYEQARANFSWDSIEQHFSWHQTGKVNMAYEAIDRHAESDRKNKIALLYSDNRRDEQYTFEQMKAKSNQFGNLLRKLGVHKGDRVFIFMPRTPELYFALLGTIKIGAVVGPLFEAFMEMAVCDRLKDSEAVAIVTTPALVSRVPEKDLPNLKHVIVVGEDLKLDKGQVDFYKEMNQASEELDIEWVVFIRPKRFVSFLVNVTKSLVYQGFCLVWGILRYRNICSIFWCWGRIGGEGCSEQTYRIFQQFLY